MTNATPTLEQKYPGLLISSHCIKDAKSKADATQNLFGWKRVELTPQEWIAELEQGRTIQPSVFEPTDDGSFTHAIKYWRSTHFVCCDADNLKGVEFLSDGNDKNHNGIDYWTEDTGLSERYPTLKQTVFAVGQSVSSMSEDKPPPHRRYRIVFLFDEPIQSEQHYHAVLLALSEQYPIIPPVERSPAQPVFGNARESLNKFALRGNVLKLSDYLMPKSEPEPAPKSKPEPKPTEKRLDDFLSEHGIEFEPCPKQAEKYFVRCPYSDHHTDGIAKPKDSYVFVNSDGKYAFKCSHDSCKVGNRSTWQAFKDGYSIRNGKHTPKNKSEDAPNSSDDSLFFSGKKFQPMWMEWHLIHEGKRYLSLAEEQGLRIYQDGIYVKERVLATKDQLLSSVQTALGMGLFKMSHYHETRTMLLEKRTPLSECDNPGHLCLKNGVLNLETMTLSDHSPDQVFLHQLPVAWDTKQSCPNILAWLRDVLDNDEDQVCLFLEAVGYTLLQTTELQKLVILEGPTKTGKSTAGKLLRALIGNNNVSNISLHAIDNEDNRFSRVRLLGKIANISSDTSGRSLKGDGYVKAVVAGDEIDAESKGIDGFTFTPNATLWAMTNRVPGSYDKTSGWYERLLIIKFEKQFLPGSETPPDTKMIDKLTTPEELSGLLKEAIGMGLAALERGHFSVTDKQVQAVQEVRLRNDSVAVFIETLQKDEWDDIEFYNLYCEWQGQEEPDAKALSKTKLADACKLHGIVRRKLGTRENRAWKWTRETEN